MEGLTSYILDGGYYRAKATSVGEMGRVSNAIVTAGESGRADRVPLPEPRRDAGEDRGVRDAEEYNPTLNFNKNYQFQCVLFHFFFLIKFIIYNEHLSR